MRQAMVHAFSEHQFNLAQEFHRALKAATDPARIEALLEEAAKEELDRVIREETKAFFTYGEGREVIRNAVIKRIKKQTK